jgi:hypothetical protein
MWELFCVTTLIVLAILSVWTEDYNRSFKVVASSIGDYFEFSWIKEILRKVVYIVAGALGCWLYLSNSGVGGLAIFAFVLIVIIGFVDRWTRDVSMSRQEKRNRKSYQAESELEKARAASNSEPK